MADEKTGDEADWRDASGRRVGSLRHRAVVVRRALEKRRASLERAVAHCPEPRPRDLERLAVKRLEIAELEAVLADLEQGRPAPPAAVTGKRWRALPDTVSAAPRGGSETAGRVDAGRVDGQGTAALREALFASVTANDRNREG